MDYKIYVDRNGSVLSYDKQGPISEQHNAILILHIDSDGNEYSIEKNVLANVLSKIKSPNSSLSKWLRGGSDNSVRSADFSTDADKLIRLTLTIYPKDQKKKVGYDVIFDAVKAVGCGDTDEEAFEAAHRALMHWFG